MSLVAVNGQLPAQIERIKAFLAESESIQEISRLHDLAEAARRYADSHEAQNYAAEVKLRCARRAGEILMAEISAGKPKPNSPTLGELGLNFNQSSRWQRMATVPPHHFEAWVEGLKRRNLELTAAGLLKLVEEQEKADRAAAKAARAETPPTPTDEIDIDTGDFRDLDIPAGSVDLVFTDPPYLTEHMPLLSDLSDHASRWLKPGGLLLSYMGAYHLPEAIRRLGEHLDYWWCAAIIHDGAWVSVKSRRVNVGWKPILIFRQPGATPTHWLSRDVVTEGHREKDGHEWQQSVIEAEWFISELTNPGDLVVEPFLGSGTVAVAARNLGRRIIGRDTDPVAVGTTLERLT